jgi:hypothetical protein
VTGIPLPLPVPFRGGGRGNGSAGRSLGNPGEPWVTQGERGNGHREARSGGYGLTSCCGVLWDT